MRRKDILARHPYKVYLSTDKYWHTYIVDESAKNKRKQIKKKTKKDLEDELVRFYTMTQGLDLSTLEAIYPQWIQYKYSISASSTSVRRMACDWNKWLKNDPIVRKPIDQIDHIEISTWACDFVKGKNVLNIPVKAKQYYNVVGVMRNLFQYAVDKGVINENIYNTVKVDKRLFAVPPRESNDQKQVFQDMDLQNVRNMALQNYIENADEIALAIVLVSFTGIRAGEACGLKWKSISEDMSTLFICSQVVKEEKLKQDGTWDKTTFKLIDTPKTDAGFRSVYIPEKIRKYLMYHKRDVSHNKPDDCVFLRKSGHFMTDADLYKKTRKYSEQVSNIARGTHKLRKTYLSRLYDGGVHERAILRLAGHELSGRNVGTTLHNSYLRDRSTSAEVEERIEQIIY